MDLAFPAEAEGFRDAVREFLEAKLPDDWVGLGALPAEARRNFLDSWRQTLHRQGFLVVSWPEQYGGTGLGPLEQYVLAEELARRGAPQSPWPTDGIGFRLIGPTILHWGTEAQKRHYLPRIISGEDRWAQGYSEPEAGSDLASLRTRAVRDGDRWILNGQKVWQTAGEFANWMFVLARTDPEAAPHKGLSLLLLPIDQPGVEVRPIRTMTGESEFTEVFMTDAEAAADDVIGEVDAGWQVALSLLSFERAAVTAAAAQYRVELERLIDLAVTLGRGEDVALRRQIGWCWSRVEMLRLLSLRALTTALAGEPPGPESSVLKLYVSEYHQRVTELALEVLGPEGLVAVGAGAVVPLGPDPWGGANTAAAWQHVFLTARAATVYGGSSQIQRTTLGERLLGLPREPRTVTA